MIAFLIFLICEDVYDIINLLNGKKGSFFKKCNSLVVKNPIKFP